MTEEELVQIGTDAEHLLNDERFKSLYALSAKRIAEQFLSIPFESRETIAELHLAKCGMDFFDRQLRQFKDAKDDILAKREEAENALPEIDFDHGTRFSPDF